MIDDLIINGEVHTAEIIFQNVIVFQRDSLDCTPIMETTDAEILTFTTNGAGGWDIILRWNDFTRRQSWTVVYSIIAATAEAVITAIPETTQSP